mmetsp:Transcript_163502/g.524245  ORF Transcript_163502/g.524245 Transcript_163502/m.524245 type:complete len:315 (+) Transcript_163502:85-1029(+)
MPHAASPVCITYAALSVGALGFEGAVPWSFEEPHFKRPRLCSGSQPQPRLSGTADGGEHGGAQAFAASASPSAASLGLRRRSSAAVEFDADTSADCLGVACGSASILEDASAWRSSGALGQLPPKRLRTVEGLWWSGRPGEASVNSEVSAEKSPDKTSSFVWGPLPALSMDADQSPWCCTAAADDLDMDDPRAATSLQGAPTREGSAAARSAGMNSLALVPYLGPAGIASWLRSGSALCMQPAPCLSVREAALSMAVRVAQVVVDDMEELRAVVVHRSQALSAAHRLGQDIRDAERYQLLDDGHVLIPVHQRDC